MLPRAADGRFRSMSEHSSPDHRTPVSPSANPSAGPSVNPPVNRGPVPRLELARLRGAVKERLFGGGEITRVGRYALHKLVATGGMGRIYLAHDEHLDRRVALKLLRSEVGGTEERTRLLREAQAGARLSHPNIVRVYDAGEHEGLVYIAMEYVEGKTLTRWLAQKRSLVDLVEIFRAAGEGLSAAHEVGLVHRDFKPDNVVIGDDGRVRVLDFGLARGTVAPAQPGDGEAPLLEQKLTATGTVMGTPAFMSPEQHRGEPVDARSDQFAFAVAMWQAVFGEHPFAGEAGPELCESILTGRRRPHRAKGVLKRLARVLDRGLASQPARRYASMRELLRELDEARSGGGRRVEAVVGVVVIGAALAIWNSQRGGSCPAASQRLEEAWGVEQRASMQAMFEASGATDATSAWKRFAARMDAHAEDWAAVWDEACSEPARTECLDERLRELGEVAASRSIESAFEGLGGLADVSGC